MTSKIAILIINVLMVSSIYVLVSLGFALVFSVMRIINFAHGAIYMIGGFVCYSFWVPLGLGPCALVLTAVIMGLFGLIVERLCFRPFYHDFEKATVMAIALIMILKSGADLTVGPQGKSMPPLISNHISIGAAVFPADRLVVLLVTCAILTVLVLLIQKTKVGQAMLAISHDSDVASLMGINTNRISAFVCAAGFGLAGLAGGLVGSSLALHVSMGDTMLVKIIGVVILAGIGSIRGLWAGGLVMGAVDTLGPYFFPNVVSGPLGFALVVLILVVRPRGFFGEEV